MSSIVPIRDKFRDIALNLSSINTFSFDDFDEALTTPNIDYRLFHLSVPDTTTIANFSIPYQDWPIECWLWEIDDQSDSESRILIWDSLEAKMNEFMKKLLDNPNAFRLAAPQTVTINRGHYAHQDSLIGVKFAFTLSAFECR